MSGHLEVDRALSALMDRVIQSQIKNHEEGSILSRIAQDIADLRVALLKASASPILTQATTRALGNQGSDPEGESGPHERGRHEAGSGQTPVDATHGRNEPASVEPAAGATAGEGDEGSEPPPAPRDTRTKKDRILDLWAVGDLVDHEIADWVGSTTGTVNVIISRARRAGDPRAVRRAGVAKAEPIPAFPPSRKAEPKPVPPAASDEGGQITVPRLDAFVAASDRYLGTAMEPTAPEPLAPEDEPAPVPALDIADRVMVVADGYVHGPEGIEERWGPKELAILQRLSDGGMYPDDVLSEIARTSNGAFTYLMNGMRAKLAGIGVELFAPAKGFWRARRAGE